MRAFISWSGDRSHRVASAMQAWIRVAFPTLDPWLSSDIEKGASWAASLLDGLTNSSIGILCVTAEAKLDWMAFEAGALLEGAEDRRSLFSLLIDPDRAHLSASPIGAFAGFSADDNGLRELAIHLSHLCGQSVSSDRAHELGETLRCDISAIGAAKVRDFELNFVLPEGSYRRAFSPLRDMEWLPAIDGVVAAICRDLSVTIKDYDFTTFFHLDMRQEKWLPLPRWISSILTDQLALVHPSFVEAWCGDAKIATEALKSAVHADALTKARARRERIWLDSAFLYGFYLLQLPNPHLRHSEIVNLFRQIHRISGIPRSWMFEVPARFLVEPDMNRLDKDLGSVPDLVAQVVSLGFTYASIQDAISFFGASGSIEQIRQLVAQFGRDLQAINPPKHVGDPILVALEGLVQVDKKDELVAMWGPLETAILGLMQWLHTANQK